MTCLLCNLFKGDLYMVTYLIPVAAVLLKLVIKTAFSAGNSLCMPACGTIMGIQLVSSILCYFTLSSYFPEGI